MRNLGVISAGGGARLRLAQPCRNTHAMTAGLGITRSLRSVGVLWPLELVHTGGRCTGRDMSRSPIIR